MPREEIEQRQGKTHSTFMKDLGDVALRAIQRAGLQQDVYLLSNDADARGMARNYLELLERQASLDPKADIFVGRLEWGTEAFPASPGLHVLLRLMQIMDAVTRHEQYFQEYIRSYGANSMIKSSTFAAVGGFDQTIGCGADLDLGNRVTAARLPGAGPIEPKDNPIQYVNTAWIDTHPGRIVKAYEQGIPFLRAWEGFNAGGYAPRGELAVAEPEDVVNDFDTIVRRLEFQITTMSEDFEYISYWARVFNFAFPPQGGKRLWGVSGSEPTFAFTETGRQWLREQLIQYAQQKRQETLYVSHGSNPARGIRPEAGLSEK